MKSKIIFVHLLNDYSGSPKVLSHVIENFDKNEYEYYIYTSKHIGFIKNVTNTYYYKRSKFKLITFINYLISQIFLFFKILKFKKQNVVIYVNTMMPFGAAIAGKIIGKRVIYHIHETSITPNFLKKFLRYIIKLTADYIVYVSRYLKEVENFPLIDSKVIYNSLSSDFFNIARKSKYDCDSVDFSIMMACSLKEYKGVSNFLKIASMFIDNKKIKFTLVLNADEIEISNYLKSNKISNNIEIIPKQESLHLYYSKSKLVLNLSHADKWVETFGLTILEAMSYGIPCIVPIVGGPIELIDDKVNGFTIDSNNYEKIYECIQYLYLNRYELKKFSINARNKSLNFSEENFSSEILKII